VKKRLILNGLGTVNGITFGSILIHKNSTTLQVYNITENDLGSEYERLHNAIEISKNQIIELKSSVDSSIGNILDMHVLMLDDKLIQSEVKEFASKNLKNIEYAYSEIMDKYSKKIASIPNTSLADRSSDIDDIKNRVINILLKTSTVQKHSIPKGTIIVAKNITPTDVLNFIHKGVTGFIIETGGTTSHAAILTRAYAIPSIFGVHNITNICSTDEKVIVNSSDNTLILNPDSNDLGDYKYIKEKIDKEKKEYECLAKEHAVTLDNTEVRILANIDLPEESENVLSCGAVGVGLYRTEFLYLYTDNTNTQVLPTEDIQFEAYKSIALNLGDADFVIRTLDLGGDKVLPSMESDFIKDDNPFLGWRAIRFCLANKDIFKTQLRAILRASVYSDISIMLPMVNFTSEILATKEYMEECKKELIKEGKSFSNNIKFGVLIETPAAALTLDSLAKHVDFFSIGSNDLIQYTLACDRTNDRVNYLYDPLHMSIMRLLKSIVDMSYEHNIPLTLCGELAGSAEYIPVLLGLGLRSLSMSTVSIPMAKKTIRSLKLENCESLVQGILQTETLADAKKLLNNFVKEKLPFIKKA